MILVDFLTIVQLVKLWEAFQILTAVHVMNKYGVIFPETIGNHFINHNFSTDITNDESINANDITRRYDRRTVFHFHKFRQ